MRLAFLGTPDAAVPTLNALVDAGHDIAVVLTRPDRRRTRRGGLEPSPVARAASAHGLNVIHRLADLGDYEFDWGIVVAYGAIIPAAALERTPMLNVHFSLLPRWRGAAPVQRAILAGDLETGVSIISLEPTLDTGPVHLERRVAIAEKSAPELTTELAQIGATALVEVLASEQLLASPVPQEGAATYAEKVTRDSLRLAVSQSAETIARVVRVGGAFFDVAGRHVVVEKTSSSDHAAAPGTLTLVGPDVVLGAARGSLVIERVRPEGSKSMDAAAWWRGLKPRGARRAWS